MAEQSNEGGELTGSTDGQQQYDHRCGTCGSGWTDTRDNHPLCPQDVKHGQMSSTPV